MRIEYVLDKFIDAQRNVRRRHGIDALDHANHRPAAVLLIYPHPILALQQVVEAQFDAFKPLIVLPDNTYQPGGILAHRVKAAEILLGADPGQMQLADVVRVIVFNLARQIDETLMGVGLNQLLHVRQRYFQHVGQALPALVAGIGMGVENMLGIQHDIFRRHAHCQRFIITVGDHPPVGRQHLRAD
ncbi:hypothetical protein D3C79_855560 [compost metagenome]